LKIIKTLDSKLPKNIRGSSVPVKMNDIDGYVCIVHYCEHGQQGLEYYHMLVKLNSDFEPIQSSNPYYFNKIGIQYCIGFTIEETCGFPKAETSFPLAESSIPLLEKNKKLYFWFSEHDSNPGLIII
jgi:hypothetical protein